MKRILVTLLLVAVLSLLPIGGIFAADDTVTVTATGEYVSFVNAPDTKALGTVLADSTVWAFAATAPADPLVDGECFFMVTNSSTVVTNTTISTSAWSGTGGNDWTSTDDDLNGTDIFAMKAGASGDAHSAMVTVKDTATYEVLKANLEAHDDGGASFKWEFSFEAPDVISDSDQKSGTITLTMTAAA